MMGIRSSAGTNRQPTVRTGSRKTSNNNRTTTAGWQIECKDMDALFISVVILLFYYRPKFCESFSVTYQCTIIPQQQQHPYAAVDTNRRRRGITSTKLATGTSELFKEDNNEQYRGTATGNVTKRTYSKNSAVSRIKQAALRACAVAAKEQQQDNIQLKNSFFSSYSPLTSKVEQMKNMKPAAVTLRQLTTEIDSQLRRARAVPWEQYHHQQRFQNFYQVSALPRDSMAAIVTHNHQNDVSSNGWRLGTAAVVYEPIVNMTTTTTQHISAAMSFTTTRHVAVVLTKRSMVVKGEHRLTVECARRIERLFHAIRNERYSPDVIVFVGEKYTNTPAVNVDCTHTSDANLGYDYFLALVHRSMDPLHHIDLTNVTLHIEPTATSSNAMANIASYIQSNQMIQWFAQAIHEANATAHEAMWSDNISPKHHHNQPHRRRPKLHVQFALISSDYHLCILNDIHVRSPGQSPLRFLDRWTTSSIIKNITSSRVYCSALNLQLHSFTGVQLETSWTYMYSTTANFHRRTGPLMFDNEDKTVTCHDDEDDANFAIASFSSICYQRAQDLVPVLQNLRGVVANTEFFQRDNYRVLVQARRSLVSGMELLYQQQPSLAAIHKIVTPLQSSHNIPTASQTIVGEEVAYMISKSNGKPLDIVLEGALLSLGRCLDLVRPAGLLTGSVPAHDFKLALMVLDQAVTQISIACDPDRPLCDVEAHSK